jgi:hypothetical protein
LGLGGFALVKDNTGFKAILIPRPVYSRTVPLVLEWNAHQKILPTPSEGLKMKSVFPLDVHRLREFYKTKNEVAVNGQTQPTKTEDTDSNETDLTPKKPSMAVDKFRRKLGSL